MKKHKEHEARKKQLQKEIKKFELARIDEIEQLLIANRYMTKSKKFTTVAVRSSKEVIAEQPFSWSTIEIKNEPGILRDPVRLGGGQPEDWLPMILAPIKDNSGETTLIYFSIKL